MSRSGEEMILELAGLLGTNTVKTAAKKDDDKEDKKPCKCGKEDCKCGCEGDSDKCKCKKEDAKKEEKEEKEDKKASVMMGVIQELVKLAGELDDAGAEEASGLVDDALNVIVASIQKKKVAQPSEEYMDEEDVTESFEEGPLVSGREDGMGSRTERTLQEGSEHGYNVSQPKQDDTPEGLGMHDFGGKSGGTVMEDPRDKLNNEERGVLEDLLRKMR